jgi:gas vesicle protein
MPDEEKRKEIRHPSFGVINISRGVCSEKMNLFGSSIQQRTFIRVDISKAILMRDLYKDWIMSDHGVPIVSVYLSPSQFADAITSLNQGEGTPCTIRYMDGHEVKEAQFESKRVQFDTEFEDKMKEVASTTNQFYTKIAGILAKPSIGKHDREEIQKQLDQLKMQIENNVPFIKRQFSEQMDETVVEAKNEVTAFIEDKIKKLGLEGYKKELQKSLEFKEEKKEEP